MVQVTLEGVTTTVRGDANSFGSTLAPASSTSTLKACSLAVQPFGPFFFWDEREAEMSGPLLLDVISTALPEDGEGSPSVHVSFSE